MPFNTTLQLKGFITVIFTTTFLNAIDFSFRISIFFLLLSHVKIFFLYINRYPLRGPAFWYLLTTDNFFINRLIFKISQWDILSNIYFYISYKSLFLKLISFYNQYEFNFL